MFADKVIQEDSVKSCHVSLPLSAYFSGTREPTRVFNVLPVFNRMHMPTVRK